MKKNKVVAIIIARQGSSRLPGKAMIPILNKSIISLIVERLRNIENIDEICIAENATVFFGPSSEQGIWHHCQYEYNFFHGVFPSMN